MVQNLLTSPKMLRDAANSKKHPEFAAAVREIELAHRHADQMVAEGRLTQSEANDFEAHLYGKFLDALPVEHFEELVKNGGMDHLQALAGHDGSRMDVEDVRKGIEVKIKNDALDQAWADGRIDDRHYATASRDVSGHTDEAMDDKLADEDYAAAAGTYFVDRNDVPDHDAQLSKYLKKTYGDRDAPDTKRNSSYDAPEGYVERNQIDDFISGITNNPNKADESSINDGIISYD